MDDLKRRILFDMAKAADILLAAALFAVCWYGYYAEKIFRPLLNSGWWIVLLLYVILCTEFVHVYGGHEVFTSRISELIYSHILALLVSDGILFAVIWVLCGRFPNPLPMLAVLAAQMLLSFIWSLYVHKWYFATFPPKETAVIYDVRRGLDKLIGEYGLDKRFHIIQSIQVQDVLADLQILDGMDAVFLSGVHSHERNIILKYCMFEQTEVYIIPGTGDILMSGAASIHMLHLPVLKVRSYGPDPAYLFLKRAFDILCSGLAIVILSPVMLITAAAIKLCDGGPVFYRQTRLTKDGKEFSMLKFRSMRVDAESDGVARLSSGDADLRITPVGRIIRRFRIDELPQLFNILAGSMSIVGPRPERPEIAAQYEKELPEFRLRLQAKAGLTGFAQVYGKYNTAPYDKLQMDLMYISHPSFLRDLEICFATVKILFMPESTDGVSVNQTTAMKDSVQKNNCSDQSTMQPPAGKNSDESGQPEEVLSK